MLQTAVAIRPSTTEGHLERHHVNTAFAPSPQFTALDRCDRCGAQAYVRVQLISGGELLFCAHHAREHAEKIRNIAITIHDETGRLEATPSVTADEER